MISLRKMLVKVEPIWTVKTRAANAGWVRAFAPTSSGADLANANASAVADDVCPAGTWPGNCRWCR